MNIDLTSTWEWCCLSNQCDYSECHFYEQISQNLSPALAFETKRSESESLLQMQVWRLDFGGVFEFIFVLLYRVSKKNKKR